MPRLTSTVQRYVVQRLAMSDSLAQVARDVKETFGLTVSRQQIQFYDPAHGAPAVKWRALFEETRASFRAQVEEIPIAQLAVRLRRYDRMASRAEERGNHKLAGELMEQAAKDIGGVFTNRRELTGKNGSALVTATPLGKFDFARVSTKDLEELERITRVATGVTGVPE